MALDYLWGRRYILQQPGAATLVAETVISALSGSFDSELISPEAPSTSHNQGAETAVADNRPLAELSTLLATKAPAIAFVNDDQAKQNPVGS